MGLYGSSMAYTRKTERTEYKMYLSEEEFEHLYYLLGQMPNTPITYDIWAAMNEVVS
jgi:hypothetical protein